MTNDQDRTSRALTAKAVQAAAISQDRVHAATVDCLAQTGIVSSLVSCPRPLLDLFILCPISRPWFSILCLLMLLKIAVPPVTLLIPPTLAHSLLGRWLVVHKLLLIDL